MSRTTPVRPARLREAAPYARCTVKTLRNRIADGTLTAWRSGPKILVVDLDEIDRKLFPPVAAIERHAGPDDPRIEPLRRELEVESLAEHAARVAPVLTPGERARIISEIAGSALPLTPEDAAVLRGLLPLGTGAVARAS